ncbi:MAG TPA: anti-sigma factor [Gemmatimonadales bacterium]|jgi:anti-sigma-K factor RskA|nr:anti-sigma factor [Gemmatimonadales bacterium]
MSDAPDSMRDLAPAYALGALSPEESRAFEAALTGSPLLQREVAEFRELGALLAVEVEQSPPEGLKARLLDRVRAEKTLPLSPGPVGEAPTARIASRRSLVPILALGFAAAVLLAVGLRLQVGALKDTLRARDSALAEREARLAEREATLNALLEPGVQLTTLTATGQAPPVVQVYWDRIRHTAILHALRLPPAPAGRTYQLWLLPKQGKPIPSRLFNTEAAGRQLVTGIPVPGDQNVAGFALTVEPAGGSPQPTSQPIVAGMAPGT